MSVLSLVSDPEFLRLSPADQQATLAQMDSGFGSLSPRDFAATVFELQKRSITVNPPGAAKPTVDMKGSWLGYLPGAGTPNKSPQTNNYQPVTQEQTPEGYQAAVQQRVAEQPVVNAAGNVAIGAGKGAGETIHTLGALAGKLLPDSVDNQIGLPTSFTEPDYLKSENGYQTAGKVAEGIAEFILGDAALKSLSIAEKLGLAQKTVKLAQDSPYIAKFLEIGMNAVRQGVVGGGQGLLHGEDLGQATTTGAITGVVGLGAGAAGEALGAGAEAAAKQEGKLMASPVPGEVENALRSGARGAIEDATGKVPRNYRAPMAGPNSTRSIFEDAANQVREQAKTLYGEIDQSILRAEGPVTDAGQGAGRSGGITQLNGQLRKIELASRTAWSDEAIDALGVQRGAVEDTINKLKATYPDLAPKLEEANSLWKQSMALSDVDKAVKISTKGMRPELNGTAEKFTQETIDPKMLFNRLNKLYDAGHLADAFGGDISYVKDIMHVLDLAQQPKNAGVFQQVITEMAKHGVTNTVGGVMGGVVGYEKGGVLGGVAGGLGGALAGAAAPMMVSKLFNSPLAMHVMQVGMENGQSATKIAAAVTSAIQVEQ